MEFQGIWEIQIKVYSVPFRCDDKYSPENSRKDVKSDYL